MQASSELSDFLIASGDAGYGHIYHVFIPPGQDGCFDATFTVCASNVFCAYHSSVDFTDVGPSLYFQRFFFGL